MNVLSSVITYTRRIIKSPSNSVITDDLIVDYINRFWILDVAARIQLEDQKVTYQFLTVPGQDRYNMPLYSVQTELGGQSINYYPVYQGFMSPVFINGIDIPLYTQRHLFNNLWPNYVQLNVQVGTGNGTNGPYNLPFPFLPGNNSPIGDLNSACIIRGHIDMEGVIYFNNNLNDVPADPPISDNMGSKISNVPCANVLPAVYFTTTAADGSNLTVADSGQFLSGNINYGILMEPGPAPYGNIPLNSGPNPYYSTNQNTINYFTGVAQNVYFNAPVPNGYPINGLCYYYQMGIPRSLLYYDNVMTMRPPPNTQYLVELNAYLSPASFLATTDAIQFAYMSEYLARGCARKILSDTGDWEQFRDYEPLFKEQEDLVWKRSQRQFTATRTQTLYSNSGYGALGWGVQNSMGLN